MYGVNLDSISWNPIGIPANIISSGIEGLVGIEECTDYNIVKGKAGKKQVNKRKLAKEISEPATDVKTQRKKRKLVKTQESIECNDMLSPSKAGSTVESSKSTETSKEGCKADSSKLTETVVPSSKALEDVSAWTDYALPSCILKAISELGFTQPTMIQATTLPAAILGRRDILGAAETGSGKTLAFGLPILAGILKLQEENSKINLSNSKNSDVGEDASDVDDDEVDDLDENGLGCVKAINNIQVNTNNKPLYALILTPTRELAMQVKKHLTQVAKYTGISIAVLVGGMAEVKQERILSKGPEIVVATPGRLWELIQSGNPHLAQIDDIRYFAIDETDRMLERGHFQELHNLLERINFNEEKKKLRQNFVFSATLTLVHQLPRHLATKKKVKNSKKIKEMTPTQKLQKIIEMLGITDPKVVDITQGTGTSGTLTECRITCAHNEKDYYVYYFLQQHPGRTLIFCNSIGCVKRLTTLLTLLNCSPLPLHASMQQRQRLKNLERFTDNEKGILIATDVAARGLDIPSVQHVLHYQTPRTSEGYVHRSGRTARASKEGITVLLMEPDELRNYLNLCRTLGKSEDLPTFPVQDNYLNAVKQRVNLARDLDKLQLQVRKANSETGWLQKAAKEMDIIIDDSRTMKYDADDTCKAKKLADIKRKDLQALLSEEIIPKGFSTRFPLSMVQIDPLIHSEQKKESAIDALKSALGASKKDKRKVSRLYKPKKQSDTKRVSNFPRKSKSVKTKKFKRK